MLVTSSTRSTRSGWGRRPRGSLAWTQRTSVGRSAGEMAYDATSGRSRRTVSSPDGRRSAEMARGGRESPREGSAPH